MAKLQCPFCLAEDEEIKLHTAVFIVEEVTVRGGKMEVWVGPNETPLKTTTVCSYSCVRCGLSTPHAQSEHAAAAIWERIEIKEEEIK